MRIETKMDDIVLLEYDFSRGYNKQPHKLKVVLTYFNNVPKIDIREYFYDIKNDEFKPTKRGIQLDPLRAEYLRKALEENAEIIDKYLFSKEIDNWVENVRKIESSSEMLSKYEFYRTISKGGIDEVIYNQNHPFGMKLNSVVNSENKEHEINKLSNLINALLLTYSKTICQIDRESKGEFGDLIDDINLKWNSLLKKILS